MATASVGETKEEEPVAAEEAREEGGKAEGGESAGAAKQGGKVSSILSSAHHIESRTRVLSASVSVVKCLVLSSSVP